MGILNNNKKKNNAALAPAELQKTLHKNLKFLASEQYRQLRANIRFTIPTDVKCPVIGITSSVRGEGKSTTAINLSYVLAHKGHKVLLIDGDLRLPSIAKKLGVKSSPGLTDLLVGSSADIASWKTEIHKNWYALPSGELPPNPSELLGSKRMENVLAALREHFDYIVIDLPPVNIVSDAMAISTFLTGAVIVVREAYTSKRDLDRCMRQISLSDINVLGFVMNDSGDGNVSYKKYGKYERYRYYRYHSAKPVEKEEFNL